MTTRQAPVPADAPDRVPCCWPGASVYILGGGPSLDLVPLGGLVLARVIAVNDSAWAAPWAPVLHYGDDRWARWHGAALARHAAWMQSTVARDPAVAPPHAWRLRYAGREGLSRDPEALNGRCSGHQAINLAVLLGAARIVLLGFDHRVVAGPDGGCRTHHRWTRPRPIETPPEAWDPWIVEARSIRADLPPGVEILNATPGSALDAFPIVDLESVLP
ncbi:hypothetical protein EDC65_2250 [Stella humosa]|uniref:Uncharacterized protein n=1 Tax=Stella humosa TaxID=94 RepID=A0A3N1M9V8_9PROT|nr:hypothetical protein [Stella humosa]ROQ00451.1 hypothetical protein EDC65_2250 [Stella humosa]BBK30304.1 hypothetical protein STHU_09380 [Stella humosa]